MHKNDTPSQEGCGHRNGNGLDPHIAATLGLHFPEAHHDPEALSAMAVAIMKKNKGSLVMLPFCCTMEAEALGANINLGDAALGPRPGEPRYRSLEEFLAAERHIDLNAKRLAAMLQACGKLARQGYNLAVEVSGPLSILSCLMELSQVIKTWRKDEALLLRAFAYLGEQVIPYAAALKKAGAALISYADPIAAPNIIGPKYSKALAENFLVSFLPNLKRALPGTPVHLCPNSARLLTDCGLGQWSPHQLRPGIAYQKGCLELVGKAGFLGQVCLKKYRHSLTDGLLNELKLSAAAAVPA